MCLATNERQQKHQDRTAKKWNKSKRANIELADLYSEAGYSFKVVTRVENCGARVRFVKSKKTGKLTLFQMFNCGDRLCPICAGIRASKYGREINEIFKEAKVREPKARFLFITLTSKNCYAEDLKEEISKMTESFNKMMKYVKIKKVVKGYVRNLEITYNAKTDTYHPHIHMVAMVSSSYYKNSSMYMKHDEWKNAWKKAMKLSYDPQVHIKAADKYRRNTDKGLEGVAKELGKYLVKPLELEKIKVEKRAEVVKTLRDTLKNVRQIIFGGLFAEIRKELKERKEIHEGDGEDELEIVTAVYNFKKREYVFFEKSKVYELSKNHTERELEIKSIMKSYVMESLNDSGYIGYQVA